MLSEIPPLNINSFRSSHTSILLRKEEEGVKRKRKGRKGRWKKKGIEGGKKNRYFATR
jgi:hypothetical protein